MTDHAHPRPDVLTPADQWDHRYSDSDQVWSGQPNVVLTQEAELLTPGRAVDVGCGEGADAVWLAEQGWEVTALDVSGVALARAKAAASARGVDVNWVHSGLMEADLPAGGFDLVTTFFPAFLAEPDAAVERRLQEWVAPGGVLLFVHHAHFDHERAKEHGFSPDDFVMIDDVRRSLGPDFTVEVDEERDKSLSAGAGAHHTIDIVLRARRSG